MSDKLYKRIEELELEVHELRKQNNDHPEAIIVDKCVHGVNKFQRASDRSPGYTVWVDNKYYSFGGDTLDEAKIRFEKIAGYLEETPDDKTS